MGEERASRIKYALPTVIRKQADGQGHSSGPPKPIFTQRCKIFPGSLWHGSSFVLWVYVTYLPGCALDSAHPGRWFRETPRNTHLFLTLSLVDIMGEKQGLTKFPSHPPCSFPKYQATCLVSCQQRRQLICKLPRCYVSAEGCLYPGVVQKIPCRSLGGPERRGSFCIPTPRRRRLGNSDSGLHSETLSQNIIKWIKRSIQTGGGFSVVSQTEKLGNFKGIVRAAAGTETATQSGISKTGCCSWNIMHGMQQLGNYA